MLEVRCFAYWPSSGVCSETVCTRASVSSRHRELTGELINIARDVKTREDSKDHTGLG
jgi:hypothetical protein